MSSNIGRCHQGPITSTRPTSFNPASWTWESASARLFFKLNHDIIILLSNYNISDIFYIKNKKYIADN